MDFVLDEKRMDSIRRAHRMGDVGWAAHLCEILKTSLHNIRTTRYWYMNFNNRLFNE